MAGAALGADEAPLRWGARLHGRGDDEPARGGRFLKLPASADVAAERELSHLRGQGRLGPLPLFGQCAESTEILLSTAILTEPSARGWTNPSTRSFIAAPMTGAPGRAMACRSVRAG